MMFTIIDISMTIQESMQVWKNYDHKKPELRTTQSHAEGKPHETRLSMDVHCGTHLDAPLHMIDGGDTIDTIPLESTIGPARVIDLTHIRGSITRADLEPFAIQRGEWLLFKTSSSLSEDFDVEFPFLRTDGALYLQEIGVKGVGTDALGIERAQPDYSTHRTLMGAGILIVEGLRLKDVDPGNYFLVVAPLKLIGIDAAPARAFLLSTTERV